MIKKKLFFAFAAVLLLSACQESLEQRCAREAMEYSKKNCPAPIAKGVTIDSMSFDVATHTLIYSYTLDGVIDDTATIRKNNPREQMLQQLKNATAMKPYRDAGYNFRYTYYSTKDKGQKLFEATFQEKDYR
ncbi:MAG: hypothetical protein IJ540_02915 [Prevotella sp.]|jgi:ADP-ribose pyrophosphatase YjhB (NUDIX family)|nr:hypothetical protein [Prevotella sp.]